MSGPASAFKKGRLHRLARGFVCNQRNQMNRSPMADQWIIDVKNGFRNQNLASVRRSDEVSIYKVPEFLVQLKQSAYVPQMVSLGPLHHAAHPEMLTHKLHATRKMFDMTDEELEKEVIGPILALVPKKYLGPWVLGSTTNWDHCLFNRNTIEYTAYPIITDILMLENQIPFFILLKILGLQGQKDEASAFTELCDLLAGARIARLFYPFKETAPSLNDIPRAQKSKHLLDLIRMYVIHSFELHKDTDQPYPDHAKREIIIPSACELRRAGIKFTKMEEKFMEISIKKNRFHLPRIRIASSVETLLRNLMALEICEAKDRCVISRYVLLMCELIHSERDVSVLRKARIIKSYMGSDREVADLFNRLSKGITRSYKDPFAKVREDAHKHYHSKIKVMVAEFIDDHCSRPWRTVSLIAACMLLLFTAVQTIYSLHRKLLAN
ncbi:UPF0481 protein At3g47200-like [Cryptomeria japonica]|uniref:UPF0481 protein At3g47200-like n=1 Tax=Cryptomeria japonica TaxID=3369 RepID=UPI0025AD8B6E|nr:UPF0481 protein At3g47200-like [Cryptomeria japonica]